MLNKHFSPFPILTTARLTLRQLSAADTIEIFELRTTPEVNKHIDRQPCQSLEEAINFIVARNEGIANNQQLYWAIILTGTNKLIGTICLFSFLDDTNQAEIGFELLPQYQNQGYMYEAAAKVMSYGMQTIGLKRFEAVAHKLNLSSVRLLRKLNFKKVDEHAEAYENFHVFSLAI